MHRQTSAVKESKVLLTPEQFRAGLEALASAIRAEFPDGRRLAIIGIRTRGAVLAEDLHEILQKHYGYPIGLGVLDITFYRDDLSRLGPNPTVRGSELPFDIHDAQVVLVDDVLFTGRTARAAMDELADYGRPALVRLAIMVDRGMRELPIQPDYSCVRISTTDKQRVRVMVEEIDGEDGAHLDTMA